MAETQFPQADRNIGLIRQQSRLVDNQNTQEQGSNGGGGLNIAESLLALAAIGAPIAAGIAPRSPVAGILSNAAFAGTDIARLIQSRKQGAATLEQERLQNEREQNQFESQRDFLLEAHKNNQALKDYINTATPLQIATMAGNLSTRLLAPGISPSSQLPTSIPQQPVQTQQPSPIPSPSQFTNVGGFQSGAIPSLLDPMIFQEGTVVNPPSGVRAVQQAEFDQVQQGVTGRQQQRGIRDLKSRAPDTSTKIQGIITDMEELGIDVPQNILHALEYRQSQERQGIKEFSFDLPEQRDITDPVFQPQEEQFDQLAIVKDEALGDGNRQLTDVQGNTQVQPIDPEQTETLTPEVVKDELVDITPSIESLGAPIDPRGTNNAETLAAQLPVPLAPTIIETEEPDPNARSLSLYQQLLAAEQAVTQRAVTAAKNKQLFTASLAARGKDVANATAVTIKTKEARDTGELFANLNKRNVAIDAPHLSNQLRTMLVSRTTPDFQRAQAVIDQQGPFTLMQHNTIDDAKDTITHLSDFIPADVVPAGEQLDINSPEAILRGVFLGGTLDSEQQLEMISAIAMTNPKIMPTLIGMMTPQVLQNRPDVANAVLNAAAVAIERYPKMDLAAVIEDIAQDKDLTNKEKFTLLGVHGSLFRGGAPRALRQAQRDIVAAHELLSTSTVRTMRSDGKQPLTSDEDKEARKIYRRNMTKLKLISTMRNALPPMDELHKAKTGLFAPIRAMDRAWQRTKLLISSLANKGQVTKKQLAEFEKSFDPKIGTAERIAIMLGYQTASTDLDPGGKLDVVAAAKGELVVGKPGFGTALSDIYEALSVQEQFAEDLKNGQYIKIRDQIRVLEFTPLQKEGLIVTLIDLPLAPVFTERDILDRIRQRATALGNYIGEEEESEIVKEFFKRRGESKAPTKPKLKKPKKPVLSPKERMEAPKGA